MDSDTKDRPDHPLVNIEIATVEEYKEIVNTLIRNSGKQLPNCAEVIHVLPAWDDPTLKEARHIIYRLSTTNPDCEIEVLFNRVTLYYEGYKLRGSDMWRLFNDTYVPPPKPSNGEGEGEGKGKGKRKAEAEAEAEAEVREARRGFVFDQTNSTRVGFYSDYQSLVNAGSKSREKTRLGKYPMADAVRNLYRNNYEAQSSMVIVQNVPEAARFRTLLEFIIEHYDDYHGVLLPLHLRKVYDLQQSWGSLSKCMLALKADKTYLGDPVFPYPLTADEVVDAEEAFRTVAVCLNVKSEISK